MTNSFYEYDELINMGFKHIGDNVLISRKASLYGVSNISIGDNVRIDDFSILSGNISIGNNVHISASVSLFGKGGIIIGDYCGCSPGCTLLSQSDDFSGEYLIGPMVDHELTNVYSKEIILENYTQLGANTVVMPGVTIKEGAVTGACSLVLEDLDNWSINIGTPTKVYKKRSKHMLTLIGDKR